MVDGERGVKGVCILFLISSWMVLLFLDFEVWRRIYIENIKSDICDICV